MIPESKKQYFDPCGISDWNEWTHMRNRDQWQRRRWSKLMRKSANRMINDGLEEYEQEKKELK